MESVEYRVVPPFPKFVAGADGSVWTRTRSGAWVRPASLAADPGRRVHVVEGGKDHQVSAARFVLEAFVGPAPSDRHMPRRIDGNPRNNALSNVEWVERRVACKAQMACAAASGYRPRGTGAAGRLSAEDVLAIRDAFSKGGSVPELAGRFGIATGHAYAVAKGRAYKNVGGVPQGRAASRHTKARLSAADVLAIREAASSGTTLVALADNYGVTAECIRLVVHHKVWRHVGGPCLPTRGYRKPIAA